MKLKTAYSSAVKAWDKKIRLVGKTPIETLYAESLHALACPAIQHKGAKTLVDIGAGNGIVGVPWLEMDPSHRAIFIEPDIKKASFLLDFISHSDPALNLGPRCLVIAKRLEDVPRETIDRFSDGSFCLVTRAFSGSMTLEQAFDLSHLKNEDLFVFTLVNGATCFRKL